MKQFLKKDLTLKILSIVFAVLLWFGINPVKTNYYTVPLNVINEEALKSKGLVLNSKAYTKYAVVSVRERRDLLESIKDSDFEVTLDLSKINSIDDKVAKIETPVYLGREDISYKNIDLKPKTIVLDLGKIEENPFIVQVETTGKLAAGYEIISKTAEPDTVSIQALDSVLSSVGSVKAYVDVTGLDKNLAIRKECKVYDKQGEEMPELGKKLTVDLKIEVGKRITIIPVTKGMPAKDFVEGTYTVRPERILITGEHNILSKVNELQTVPIDIENADKTLNTQVILQLPEGIRLVGAAREVNVTVEIIANEERNFQVLSNNIIIEKNKSDINNFNYEVTDNINVKLKGTAEDLNNLNISNLSARVNVDDLQEGEHKVPLHLNLPNNVTQVEEVLVPVNVTK